MLCLACWCELVWICVTYVLIVGLVDVGFGWVLVIACKFGFGVGACCLLLVFAVCMFSGWLWFVCFLWLMFVGSSWLLLAFWDV